MKRPTGFPVPEVLDASPAAEVGCDLIGKPGCLDAVKKPVGAQCLPEKESVFADANDPGGSESGPLLDTDSVPVYGFF